MTKEDEIISKLGLLMLEIKATYTANIKEEKALRHLFKSYNELLNARYEV